MSLPSRYAPEGLSEEDQLKVITLGERKPRKPIDYKLRTIDDRVQLALHTHPNTSEDIEMIPIEDGKQVDVISEYIEYLRGNSVYEDKNEMVIEESPEFEIVGGNISFLVLDTNFLISHLNIVDTLKNIASEYGLKLIIPVYVVQELDGLKNSNRLHNNSNGKFTGETVSQLAIWANRWIYQALADSLAVVKGQKLSQRISKDLVKDDAIFDCCLYFKKTYPQSLVILLSNDKNLCAKALSNDVLTVSFRENMSGRLIANTIYEENVERFGKLQTKVEPVAPKIQNHVSSEVIEPSNEWVEKTQQIDELTTFEQVSEKVYNEIQMILLAALDHCMVAEYGDDLDLIQGYDKNSVTTIEDCAELIIRFWMTVFLQYFDATPGNFVPFRETGKGRNSRKTPIHIYQPEDSNEFRKFVTFWTTVLTVIYDAVMDSTQQTALKWLIARWNKMADTV
mgnify:CR=1 FL=1